MVVWWWDDKCQRSSECVINSSIPKKQFHVVLKLRQMLQILHFKLMKMKVTNFSSSTIRLKLLNCIKYHSIN